MKLYKKFTSSDEPKQQTRSVQNYGMGLREWSIVGVLVVVEVAIVLLSAQWVISML